MISAFSGFILMDDPIIKSMGFALAAGVAIDAFVVRMTIAPAVMSLLGDKAWWLPRWLGPGPSQGRRRGRGPAHLPPGNLREKHSDARQVRLVAPVLPSGQPRNQATRTDTTYKVMSGHTNVVTPVPIHAIPNSMNSQRQLGTQAANWICVIPPK
jgi:MMPL family